MSRASPLIRALPRTTSRPAVRSYHPSLSSQAATASAPSSRPTTPRRVAVPASAARLSRAAPPKPFVQNPTQARVAPTASSASAGVEDDFDMPMPEMESIEDYAHLTQSSTPAPSSSNPRTTPPTPAPRASASSMSNTRSSFGDINPSPPLTSFPNDGYRPLPTVAAGEGVGVSLGDTTSDWSTSFAGLSQKPFDREVADALLRPLQVADIELKPDGLLYLPEIKYRRTLNAAFGPGGWGLAPRGETHVGPRIVSREWGLVCLGRLVSIARGEQEYFDPSGVPTATEACKSNALMRCCKDLGIASELWDPSFIREFKSKHCVEVWVEHSTQKKKRKMWRKKTAPKFDYPYKEVGLV